MAYIDATDSLDYSEDSWTYTIFTVPFRTTAKEVIAQPVMTPAGIVDAEMENEVEELLMNLTFSNISLFPATVFDAEIAVRNPTLFPSPDSVEGFFTTNMGFSLSTTVNDGNLLPPDPDTNVLSETLPEQGVLLDEDWTTPPPMA